MTHRPTSRGSSLELIVQEELVIGRVLAMMDAHGVTLVNLQKRESTLEDVFVTLVGESMENVEEANVAAVH